MTQYQLKQLEDSIVKSACIGFTQSLINRGYSPEAVAQANIAYADRQQGLLVKRAANRAALRQGIMEKVAQIRRYYGYGY